MQTASKKVVNGWAMYDWANSVYNLVITTTFFPIYYLGITGDGDDKTKTDYIDFLNECLSVDFLRNFHWWGYFEKGHFSHDATRISFSHYFMHSWFDFYSGLLLLQLF